MQSSDKKTPWHFGLSARATAIVRPQHTQVKTGTHTVFPSLHLEAAGTGTAHCHTKLRRLDAEPTEFQLVIYMQFCDILEDRILH